MVGTPGLVENPHRAEWIWWLTLVVKLTYREGGFSVEELRTRDWLVGMPVGQFPDCYLVEEGPASCGWCHPWADESILLGFYS